MCNLPKYLWNATTQFKPDTLDISKSTEFCKYSTSTTKQNQFEKKKQIFSRKQLNARQFCPFENGNIARKNARKTTREIKQKK